VVQTATSVNGFADDQSVLLVKGVKRTTPTRWPDALIADADVLVGAPVALNLAGVGDLAAMFTAPADWRLASLLDMADSYSPTAVELVRTHGSVVLSSASGLARGDREAATTIAHVLTLSGISMGVAGTTAPASGMEHTVSHLIEMAMNKRGKEAAHHGAQVGVSAVLAACLWSRVRAYLDTRSRPELAFPPVHEMEARVHDSFSSLDASGEMGDECWRLYIKKLTRWEGNRPRLETTDWAAVISSVNDLLVDPSDLVRSLASAGAPVRFSELDPPIAGDLARWALANCHLMRDRFTVADLAFFLGVWDDDGVESVVTEAARMGAGL
jgi:glycerol-1-phosphate dehydrogenase [NAD(P)+]